MTHVASIEAALQGPLGHAPLSSDQDPPTDLPTLTDVLIARRQRLLDGLKLAAAI